MKDPKKAVILIAEDDPDDRLLLKEATAELNLPVELHFVEDGDELIEYLHHLKECQSPGSSTVPGLILLDLNMPRKDGRQALKEINEERDLDHIPLVVLTTSNREEDVRYSYERGAKSYVTKPSTFEGLKEIMKSLYQTWFVLASNRLKPKGDQA